MSLLYIHHSLLSFSLYSSGFNDLVDFDLLAPTAGATAAPTASWGGELMSFHFAAINHKHQQ